MSKKWAVVAADLERLQERLDAWRALPDHKYGELFQQLAALPERKLNALFPHTKGSIAVGWLVANHFNTGSKAYETLNHEPIIRIIRAGAQGPFAGLVKPFREAVDAYEAAWNALLKQAAPSSFNFEGFRVLNPFHLTHRMCGRLLGGVQKVISLFKQRDLEDLLHDQLRVIEIDDELTSGGRGATGLYHPDKKKIDISPEILEFTDGKGKLSGLPVAAELFIHEFGHHVHLTLLHPEARALWDGAWDEFREKKAVPPKEVARLIGQLKEWDWDLHGLLRSLNLDSRKKLELILRNPKAGDSLLEEDSLRLSPRGLSYFNTMDDPDVPEQRKNTSLAAVFGIGKSDPLLIPNLDQNKSPIGPALGIPSDYGATDEMEDFAETFVLFVTKPNLLSPTALFRMKQTLAISGLYGKQIMRVGYQPIRQFRRRRKDRNIKRKMRRRRWYQRNKSRLKTLRKQRYRALRRNPMWKSWQKKLRKERRQRRMIASDALKLWFVLPCEDGLLVGTFEGVSPNRDAIKVGVPGDGHTLVPIPEFAAQANFLDEEDEEMFWSTMDQAYDMEPCEFPS